MIDKLNRIVVDFTTDRELTPEEYMRFKAEIARILRTKKAVKNVVIK